MGTDQPRITKTEYYALAMEGRLEQPTRRAYTLANTLCVAPTQRGSTLSIYILRAMFLPACSLPAGTDNAAQPTRRQQPPTARATATHHSPNRSRCHQTPPTPTHIHTQDSGYATHSPDSFLLSTKLNHELIGIPSCRKLAIA